MSVKRYFPYLIPETRVVYINMFVYDFYFKIISVLSRQTVLLVDETGFTVEGWGLWCLTSLSTIFQLYRGGQFYWRREPEYPEKTTDHRKLLTWQTLSHNIVSSAPRHERIRTHVNGDRHWLHPTLIRSQFQAKTINLPEITDKGSWPSILCIPYIHLKTRLCL